jgi:hypothetical protein
MHLHVTSPPRGPSTGSDHCPQHPQRQPHAHELEMVTLANRNLQAAGPSARAEVRKDDVAAYR